MNAPFSIADCHEVLDRFDAFLDGNLDAATTARFEQHVNTCPDCAAEHAVALRMSQTFREIALEPCPDDVLDRAITAAKVSQNGQADGPPANQPRPRVLRWKAWAVAASVLLLLGLGSLPFLLNTAEAEFSADEIAQARQEVELALSLVSDAGRETGVFLQHDILNDEVVQPIQRTISPRP